MTPTEVVSVVVPVFKCGSILSELYERCNRSIRMMNMQLELILVCDGDREASWSFVEELSRRFPERVRGILLARNRGQHVATSAGIAAASGRFTIVMDCDLQDPPEAIPDLVKLLENGADVASARMSRRGPDTRSYRFARRAYARMHRSANGLNEDQPNMSFFAMSSKARAAVLEYKERDRHISAIVRDTGFPVSLIDVTTYPSPSRPSSYSFQSRFRLAMTGLVLSSSLWMKSTILGGLILSVGSLFSGIALVALRLAGFQFAPGWVSVIVLVLMTFGINMIMMGGMGFYVITILNEVRARPLYVIDHVVPEPLKRGS